MAKKQRLTEFIQIRVSVKEKEFIQLIAKKHSNKGISSLILDLLHQELNRLSCSDMEIKLAKEKLMQV